MKRLVCLILISLLLFSGCGQQDAAPATQETTEPPTTVGLCLPGRGADWRDQAQAITAALEAKDIVVYLEYASEDVLLQQSQVQSLLNLPVDCLILGAYDPLTLCQTLENATIPVLAYDRQLRFGSNVSGFVGVDYYTAGVEMANFALSRYDAEKELTIELLMGQPQDPNALSYYQGVMSVVQPLLDSGKLRCLSGRTMFEDVCISGSGLEAARDLCFDYLSMEYEETFPDIFLCGNDLLAEGCIQALEGMAFTPQESWPVVTGLGCTEDGQWLLEAGTLTATAKVDTDALVAACVEWTLALLEGSPLPENTPTDNGTISVPTMLLPTLLTEQ